MEMPATSTVVPMPPPARRSRDRCWRTASLAFCLLMLLVHAVAGFNTAGVGDFWRDIYWAAAISRGEAYPLVGPPIYGLVELGPWWFYLLAVPIWLTGSVAATAAFVQVLAGLKYVLAWRLGARFAGERFGFALATSLCVAGWSTMTLMFPSHTAVIETTLLLLAFATWICWHRLSIVRALLFGLACGACLNAHPTTATFVVLAGGALAVRHASWHACALVAFAALVAALTLAPPFLAPDVPARARSLLGYAGADVGVDVVRRSPELVASAIVGGAWNGFLLMTTWSLATARIAWFVYAGGLTVCAIGFAVLPASARHVRAAAAIAAIILVLQASVLVALRPVTPMWMLPSLLPPLAVVVGSGWYGWIVAERNALRVAALAAFGVFIALSIIPYALFMRDLSSVREARGANPYYNAVEFGTRFDAVPVPWLPARRIDVIAASLCEDAVLHGRLAWAIEQSLATPVKLACGRVPDLRFGGRDGPARHVAGIFVRAAEAGELVPDRIVEGIAFFENVRPIAPEHSGRVQRLRRDQIYPDAAAAPATRFAISFAASPRDVIALTNRFPLAQPLKIAAVTVDGRPARRRFDDGGSMLYDCADCAGSDPVGWRFELEGVDDDLDLAVIVAAHRASERARASGD